MTQTFCPKCKNAVNENDIRCNHCNMRLKQICPSCNTANRFGVEVCTNCETILIKYCENCGSANLPTASVCRKCNNPLVIENEVITFEKKRSKQKEEKYNIENSEETEILPTVESNDEEEQQDLYPQEETFSSEEYTETENYNEYIENQEENIEVSEDIEDIISKEEFYEEENIISGEESQEEEFDEENIQQQEVSEEEKQEDFSEEYDEEEQQQETVTEEQEEINSENKPEPLTDTIDEENEIVVFENSDLILEQLLNIMQTENNAIITGICAEEGMGKTTLVKTFVDTLAEKGIISILSETTELLKVSPYGAIRDALLKLLTLPDCHPDAESFYSEETKQLFVQNFETLTDAEISDFMNFLYPKNHSYFENLIENKEKTYNLLEKIFTSITTKNNSIFIIDNFELIDTSSFEFIQNLIEQGIINNKTKLFITYKEKKSARVYFDKEISSLNIFATLFLQNLEEEATLNLIKSFANTNQVPTAVSFAVNEKGKGNIYFTEQFLALLFDVGYMYIDSNMMKFKESEPIPFLPKTIEEIIKLRFNALTQPELKDTLLTASIIGCKFDKSAFAAITDITEEQAGTLLQQLVDLMFIQPVSEYEYSFKNLTTWSVIFEIAEQDPRFKVICKKVYYILSKYALSNPIMKAAVAKYRDEAEIASQAWLETALLSAYLGDSTIYAISLEQYLVHTGYSPESTEITDIQLEAMEKIAKLIYKTNPQKAIQYLSPIIVNAKEAENHVKLIDLCSYIIKACYKVSDYSGVIESVDLILTSTENDTSELDKALIKSRKLNALFKTGNCEEGLNLANNEIIPILEEALSKENNPEFAQSLLTAWFDTSINMIYLFALQGNSKAIELANNTAEIIQMNNIDNPKFQVKLNLARAFALTIVGKIQESSEIIKETEKIQEYNNSEYITIRNIIFTLNLVFANNTENLKEILFNYAQYAENANDNFGKHIYKLILAWLTSHEGDYNKANIIFNEELTHYANEKIVTGALISWLFIASNTLKTEGIENAERIAMKALEVSQNPKFSQYHISVYIHKLIAEINLIKGDIAATKMYLEKGMLIAKQFGLDLAQIQLYRAYAKFLEYSMTQQGMDKNDLATKTNKIYINAITQAEAINHQELAEIIKQERENLVQFCNEQNIAIK